jgi:hypothetical protein
MGSLLQSQRRRKGEAGVERDPIVLLSPASFSSLVQKVLLFVDPSSILSLFPFLFPFSPSRCHPLHTFSFFSAAWLRNRQRHAMASALSIVSPKTLIALDHDHTHTNFEPMQRTK